MPESTPPDRLGDAFWLIGQEKRYYGGPAQTQAGIFGSARLGRHPADGERPRARRAPPRRLRGSAADPWPVFQPVRFAAASRALRTGATTDRRRQRPGQGRPAAAAVGVRQRRGRRTI